MAESEQDRELRDRMTRNWYVEGYTIRQIAKKIEQSESTVRKILNADPEWRQQADSERSERISERKFEIVRLADDELLRRLESDKELMDIQAKELAGISSTFTKDARLIRGEATEITANQSRPEISIQDAQQVLQEAASAGTALDPAADIG